MPEHKVLLKEQVARMRRRAKHVLQDHVAGLDLAESREDARDLLAALDSLEALRAKLAKALDSAATAEQDQEILHRELDAALAREEALRGALESAPMPGVSPLTGPEILAGDLHVACRSIISAYADWWEQKRGPVLAATPAEGVKNA